MNIYTDIILPAERIARAVIHWPKVEKAEWFPRFDYEPDEVQFVQWFDRTLRDWRIGKVDGIMPSYWGSTWVHVTTKNGATKWLRWSEVPWVQ